MPTHKKQVLLCGTQYGQSYLPAIFQAPQLELMGIVANGSDRSVRLAEQYAVPLYRQPEQIDQPVDLACLAVNEQVAVTLAESLLPAGIDVLVEHPIGIAQLQRILALAEQHNRRCQVNSHFSELPPVAQFIRLSQMLNQTAQPLSVALQCNSRTLFSLLDILLRCFASVSLAEVTVEPNGDYRSCTMLLNGIPVTLHYQHWRYATDDSTDSPLGHQLTFTYPDGVLQLAGTFGPCLWAPIITAAMPRAAQLSQSPGAMAAASSLAQAIDWRKQANQQAMLELVDKQVRAHHQPSYQRSLCQLWSELMAKLGYQTAEANSRTQASATIDISVL